MLEASGYVALSLALFVACLQLQRRLGLFFLNPLLLSLTLLIVCLRYWHISYERYMTGGQFIAYFIEPAVVALGFPLYKQLHMIGREWRALLLICVAAVCCVLTTVVLVARAVGIEDWVIKSAATLCITTAIAMETSDAMGGSASLAAVTVMIAGFTGSALGLQWLRFLGIRDNRALGLAIGSASHALGTATVARYSYESSAYASAALILCAIITAVLAPVYVPLLMAW